MEKYAFQKVIKSEKVEYALQQQSFSLSLSLAYPPPRLTPHSSKEESREGKSIRGTSVEGNFRRLLLLLLLLPLWPATQTRKFSPLRRARARVESFEYSILARSRRDYEGMRKNERKKKEEERKTRV